MTPNFMVNVLGRQPYFTKATGRPSRGRGTGARGPRRVWAPGAGGFRVEGPGVGGREPAGCRPQGPGVGGQGPGNGVLRRSLAVAALGLVWVRFRGEVAPFLQKWVRLEKCRRAGRGGGRGARSPRRRGGIGAR